MGWLRRSVVASTEAFQSEPYIGRHLLLQSALSRWRRILLALDDSHILFFHDDLDGCGVQMPKSSAPDLVSPVPNRLQLILGLDSLRSKVKNTPARVRNCSKIREEPSRAIPMFRPFFVIAILAISDLEA